MDLQDLYLIRAIGERTQGGNASVAQSFFANRPDLQRQPCTKVLYQEHVLLHLHAIVVLVKT